MGTQIDKKLLRALKDFQKKYPLSTSADLQTFILGWNAKKESDE